MIIKLIDKQELYDQYVTNNKTIKETAETLNVAVGTVFNYLKKYGIKTREQHKGFEGKHHTEETKLKISQKNKGKIVSEETKQKMSESKTLDGMGHKKKRRDGYIGVYFPKHPKANKSGYVMEHHLVMEEHIGRPLRDDEVVHHINHIRDDNSLNNLQLMTFKEHAALHMKERHKRRRNDLSIK